MTPGRDQTVELLHALGHLYARHSQPKRGLVLLLIAARLAPNDRAAIFRPACAFRKGYTRSWAVDGLRACHPPVFRLGAGFE